MRKRSNHQRNNIWKKVFAQSVDWLLMNVDWLLNIAARQPLLLNTFMSKTNAIFLDHRHISWLHIIFVTTNEATLWFRSHRQSPLASSVGKAGSMWPLLVNKGILFNERWVSLGPKKFQGTSMINKADANFFNGWKTIDSGPKITSQSSRDLCYVCLRWLQSEFKSYQNSSHKNYFTVAYPVAHVGKHT